MTTQLQKELIAQVRDSALLQVDLARRTGYSQKHLSMVLNGHVEGTLTMWQNLLDAINDTRDVYVYKCDGCGRKVRRDGDEPQISSYCDRLGETRTLIRVEFPEITKGKCPACGHEWAHHDQLLQGVGRTMISEYNPYGVDDMYECNAYAGMGNWCGCHNRSRQTFVPEGPNGAMVPVKS